VTGLARKKDLCIAAAGTHPFSSWVDQEITPLERYVGVKQDMQDLAQQLLIFGTHVHIGIEDREFLIDAMNVSRYFLPHLLCLTSSSPFWVGRNTGLKSYRSVVFRNFPRTGIPRVMQLARRLRVPGRTAGPHTLHPGRRQRSTGTCGRTTAIPPWSSGSPTCARAWRRPSAWPPSCRPSSRRSGSCGGTT
jgi:hypothetical protein